MLLLAACSGGSGEVESFLTRTEKLLLSDPQSAYDSLCALKSKISEWPRSLQMRYWFDYIDAKNQSYISLSEQEDLDRMKEVADYYDGDDEREARAYYLLGSVYRDHGDGPQAIQNWQKGISKAKGSKGNKNRLISLLYFQVGSNLMDQYILDESLEYNDSAYKYAMLQKDTVLAISSYINKTAAYGMLDMEDSIIPRAEYARKILLQCGDTSRAATCLFEAIRIKAELGDTASAREYLRIYETESGWFNENGSIIKGKELFYYVKGLFLLSVGEHDKAKELFIKELSLTNDWDNKQAAYRGLSKYYKTIGVYDSAYIYSQLQSAASDSSVTNNDRTILKNLVQNYNYSQHQQQALIKVQEVSRLQKLLFTTIFVIVIMIAVIIIYRRLQQAKILNIKLLISQKENEITYLEECLNQYNHDTNSDINLIESIKTQLKNKEEEIAKLKRNLRIKRKTTEEKLQSSRIKTVLKHKAECGDRVSNEEWSQLEEMMTNIIPRFVVMTKRLLPNISTQDFRVLLLVKLGFSNKEIASLIFKEASTIYSILVRNYEKAHNGDKGTAEKARAWISEQL